MIDREQFLAYMDTRHVVGAPVVWTVAASLISRGFVRPEMVTREAFPGVSRYTRGNYRAAIRRVLEAEAAQEGAA